MQVVLGLNCSHDASACIMVNGQLVFAVAEERLSRQKHHFGFPERAIVRCLEAAGPISLRDVDCVVVNQMAPWEHESRLRTAGCRLVIANPSHHLLHACYAFSLFSTRPASCLVVDGSGYSLGEYLDRRGELLDPHPGSRQACEAWSLFRVERDGAIQVEARQWEHWHDARQDLYRFPSLGHMYSMAAQYTFGSWHDAGKVMGLSAYGLVYPSDHPIVTPRADGLDIDTRWVLEVAEIEKGHWESGQARAVAARVQHELERGMQHLAAIAKKRHPADALLLTGGVALNPVCNELVRACGHFGNFEVTPAAGDSGIAVGAAAYGVRRLTGELPTLENQQEFCGGAHEDKYIEKVLAGWTGVRYCHLLGDEWAYAIADAIRKGLVVGLLNGRSELGPRALGHRSILADARLAEMKDRLNRAVKFREPFRPFGASILEERCSEWLDLSGPSAHMLYAGRVREAYRDVIPAVVHIDGSCRIQTVGRTYNGVLRQVLEHFDRMTGVPLVVNTSLNLKGDPICESPDDAMETLMRSKMDTLFIEGWQISKS